MSRNGSLSMGLLHNVHAGGCDGREFSTCRPLVVPSDEPHYHDHERSAEIVVVLMVWYEECAAADWEGV
jgi:hypothetical protein